MTEDMLGVAIAPVALTILFVILPWIVFHYITKWKLNSRLTADDERMLDELYELARRLDDRMATIERIIDDENPNWNPLAGSERRPAMAEDRSELDAIESELQAMRGRKAGEKRTNLAKRERA